MAAVSRHRRLVIATVGCLVVAGCAVDESGLVAARHPGGDPARLELVFAHCPSGPDVGTARLTDIDVRAESEPSPVDPDLKAQAPDGALEEVPDFSRRRFDRVLWSVHADPPTSVDSVVVGETPDGFTGDVALDEPLPERVLVTTRSAGGDRASGATADLSVIVANVPVDDSLVLDVGGVTTLNAFVERVAADECGGAVGDDETLGDTVSSLLVRLALLMGGALAVLAAGLAWRRRGVVDGGHPT